MRVFKACFTIMKRHMVSFSIYFFIFIALSVVMSSLAVKNYTTNFEAVKPNFSIINRDQSSEYIKGFTEFLNDYGTEVLLEDNKKALQDAAFFHAAEYIVIIPKNFTEQFLKGTPPELQVVMTPNSAAGYYMDSIVNQYWNLLHTYHEINPDVAASEIIELTKQDLSIQATAEKEQFLDSQPIPLVFEIFNRMMCYILLVLIILCVSTIFLAFKRPDLQMRNMISPMKPSSMGGQIALYNGFVAFGSWLLLNIVGIIFYGSQIANVDIRILLLLLLSSFIFMLVALSIALLAGRFVNNENVQNIVSNFLSLALCFLGGVFVPLEMLGANMLAIAKFTPTYWYITTIESICNLTSFENLDSIFVNLLILLGYAVAIFCVYLVVNKYKNRAEQSFGQIQTELEA